MSKRTHKIVVTNVHAELFMLFLEPWGEHYYLKPKETFEVVAEGAEDAFYFEVTVPETETITVWVNGNFDDISVRHDGVILECGHNNPPLENEQTDPPFYWPKFL